MSFPKAPLKRFNEHVGCTPAPGSYDVKNSDNLKGPVSFEKSQRFRSKKEDPTGGSQSMDKELTSPARLRKNSSLGSTPNLRQKPEKNTEFIREMKKKRMLEKEIRSLMKERAEQNKRFQALEEEFKKTEVKLGIAKRERTSLSANVASLERQIADLDKANDLLKAKFSDDSMKKKINSLCAELMEAKNKVDARDKAAPNQEEICCLQVNFEEQFKMLHSTVEASSIALHSLKERNNFLEESRHEANLHNEVLEKELDQVQTLIEELRGENKNLEGYLGKAQEQMQDLRIEMSSMESAFENKLQLVTSTMSEQQSLVIAKLEEMEKKFHEAQNNLDQTLQELSRLEEELIATNRGKSRLVEETAETERKLSASLEEISGVLAQAEKYKLHLDQTEELVKQKDQERESQKDFFRQREEELLAQIKELEVKYSMLVQETEKLAMESQSREQHLNVELEMLKQKLSQGEGLQVLQNREEELHALLQKEMEMSNSLRLELQKVQEEMIGERHLLEEELEGTLDELDRLQLEEEQADKLIFQLEQENKQRAVELAHLEGTLKAYV
ncbi:hypothetical protein FKM82_012009 [Ascaphus truei]